MRAHVFLNLSNELGKRDKMQGLPSISSLFRNELNKFNNTRARMLDSIYHMTNTLKSHFWRKNVIILSLCTQCCYGRHNVSRCNRPEFPPSQFFPRGKNGPAHSFPREKVVRPIISPPSQFPPPPNNFKNHNGIVISLHKFKKPLLN